MTNNTNMNSRSRTYSEEKSHTNLTRTSGQNMMNAYSVPPIDEITGESVMPSDSMLVPMVPAAAPKQTINKDPNFSQGYLQKHIGQSVRVEFLIGTDGALIDRTGILTEVGENFIVLNPFGTDDSLMCDLFSIKFVTIRK